jgi:hypothetical protein
MPPERSMDETIVRAIALAFTDLMKFSESWDVTPGFTTILKFTSANMLHLLDKSMDPAWKKVSIKDMHQMDVIEKNMTKLVWTVLSLGKMVNAYRKVVGRLPINWISEATDLEKRRTDAEISHNGKGQVQQ